MKSLRRLVSENCNDGLCLVILTQYRHVTDGVRPMAHDSSSPSKLLIQLTLQLHIPPYRLSTDGRRSFPVAASIFWNTLPDDVQSAPSVSSFRRQLKTFLFQ